LSHFTPIGTNQPNINTRKLVVEEGGFKYDSDSYADDLPYWSMENGAPHLIIPYTLSENDMKFTSPSNFATGDDFSRYLKENLKYLVEEGKSGYPKMMSVGLHCRLARPGRVAGIADFLDYARKLGGDVWICTREDIADFWYEHHYPMGAGKPVRLQIL
jgi:allantoinase